MLTLAKRYKAGKWGAENRVTASINFTRGAMQALLASFVKQLYNLGHAPLSDSPIFFAKSSLKDNSTNFPPTKVSLLTCSIIVENTLTVHYCVDIYCKFL